MGHIIGEAVAGAAQKKPHKEAVVFFNSIQGWIQCCCKILKINTRKVQTADIVYCAVRIIYKMLENQIWKMWFIDAGIS